MLFLNTRMSLLKSDENSEISLYGKANLWFLHYECIKLLLVYNFL